MKVLSFSDLEIVFGGASSSSGNMPSRQELERECRDDIINGMGMGAAAGGVSIKGNVFLTGAATLVGGTIAIKYSDECQALASLGRQEKAQSTKDGNNYGH